MTSDLATLQTIINHARRLVFFGGAGVSTESGIPDFRSQDGLYHQKYDVPPETILSHSYFVRHTEAFYRFYRDKMICLSAKPRTLPTKNLLKWSRKAFCPPLSHKTLTGCIKWLAAKRSMNCTEVSTGITANAVTPATMRNGFCRRKAFPTAHAAAEGSSRTWCCMRSPCRNRRWSRQSVPSLRQTCFSSAGHP